jgi:hypothetical protein
VPSPALGQVTAHWRKKLAHAADTCQGIITAQLKENVCLSFMAVVAEMKTGSKLLKTARNNAIEVWKFLLTMLHLLLTGICMKLWKQRCFLGGGSEY